MLHLRKFNWEHIKVYTDLYNKINSFDFTARLYHKESMGKILSLPGADPESNLVMAYWDGKAVGFTHVVKEQSIKRIVLTGGVIKQYQRKGIGSSLLINALERIGAYKGYVCHVQSGERQKKLIALLKSMDFLAVNEYSTMVLKAPELINMKKSSVYNISIFQKGKEEMLLTDIQNDVFKDSWGFAPNTVDEITARMNLDRAESNGVHFVRNVRDPSKRVAAYCWTLNSKNIYGHIGWVSMVGATAQHRGKGVGLMATVSGINYLVCKGVEEIELEVATGNNPAIELYRKLGFEIVSKTVWFEKQLL